MSDEFLESRLDAEVTAHKDVQSQRSDAFAAWCSVTEQTMRNYVCRVFAIAFQKVQIDLGTPMVKSKDSTNGPCQDGVFPLYVCEAEFPSSRTPDGITTKIDLSLGHKQVLWNKPKVTVYIKIKSATYGTLYSTFTKLKVKSFSEADVKPQLEKFLVTFVRDTSKKMGKHGLL